jgi:hypothetical protein
VNVKAAVEMTHFKSKVFFTEIYRTHPKSNNIDLGEKKENVEQSHLLSVML